MAVERSTLLPAGRYWVTVVGADAIARFDAWLARYREQANVRVLSTSLDAGGWNRKPSQFIVFEVIRPGVVSWEGPGLPNKIPPGAPIPSRSDTAKRPDPERSIIDKNPEESAAMVTLLLLGLGYLFLKQRKIL